MLPEFVCSEPSTLMNYLCKCYTGFVCTWKLGVWLFVYVNVTWVCMFRTFYFEKLFMWMLHENYIWTIRFREIVYVNATRVCMFRTFYFENLFMWMLHENYIWTLRFREIVIVKMLHAPGWYLPRNHDSRHGKSCRDLAWEHQLQQIIYGYWVSSFGVSSCF
jgi:hypothetical protein